MPSLACGHMLHPLPHPLLQRVQANQTGFDSIYSDAAALETEGWETRNDLGCPDQVGGDVIRYCLLHVLGNDLPLPWYVSA